MLRSLRWSSLALVALGLSSACGRADQPGSMAQAGGPSAVAGAITAGAAPPGVGGDLAGSGGSGSGDGGSEPVDASAGTGPSGAGAGGSAEASSGGEPNAGAGGPNSIPSCPTEPATFSLGCEDVVALWSPIYVFDSNQWLLDASRAELPMEYGSLTFFNSYSTREFPVCGVVSIDVSESLLLATPTMDSHYLITAQIARFQVSDVCGNHYVYEPSGRACSSIVADEASSWRGACAKTCPGPCD